MDSENLNWSPARIDAESGNAPSGGSAWIAVILLLLSAVSMATLDHRCSSYLNSHHLTGEITNLFDAIEHFGTPYGAVLILVTVWLCLPHLRSRVSRTLFAAIAAGLLADLIKLCIGRTRPTAFDFDQSIWASFTGAFQWGAGGSRQQGFPSAHTAFAIAFAVMLSDLFPQARRWFLGLGAMVALQRVTTSAHFPSDVLAGAAVGWLTARCFLGTAPIGRLYDRLEHHYFPDARVPVGAVVAPATRLASASPERNLINGTSSEPVGHH